ncbi:MAG: hypothetical protein RR969_03795 [Thermomonas sp.]
MQQLRWREQARSEDDHGDESGPVVADPQPADAVFAPCDPDALDAAHPSPGNTATDPTEPGDAGFNVEAFAGELVARMRNDSARAFDAWLESNEWLYSVDRKQALQPIVVQALAQVEPAIAAEHFDPLTRFFALDTVGIDGWLRTQLDLVQRRIHDASRFEHQLRLHTSKYATWTDVQLAKELFGPPHWLRRPFLLLVPGLPGRLATLAQNLHAASPEASEAQLHQPTCRFWDRATDRAGFARERLLVVGIRALLFSLAIAAYVAAIDVDGTFAHNWLVCLLGVLLPWLAYAVIVAGFLRFRRFNQTRLHWDMPTLLACTGSLASAIAMQLQPIAGLIGFAITGLLWLGARGGPEGKANANAWGTIAAAATSFMLAGWLMHLIFGEGLRARHGFTLAGLHAMAMLVLHDVVLAKQRRIPLQAAHLATGWVWWIAAINLALLAVVGWLSTN